VNSPTRNSPEHVGIDEALARKAGPKELAVVVRAFPMNHELTALRAGRRTDDLPGGIREKPLVVWTGPANPGMPAVPATNRPKAGAARGTGDRSDE
jgi:hypothetical protein